MDSSENLRDDRRRRFQAKQERIVAEASKEEHRDGLSASAHEWILANSSLCTVVDIKQVNSIQEQMAAETRINSVRSPVPVEKSLPEIFPLEKLLHPYFDLYSRDIPHNKIDQRRRFIAEGTETIRLLVQQSRSGGGTTSSFDSSGPVLCRPIEIESIFLKPNLFFEEPVCLAEDVKQALDLSNKLNLPAKVAFHILFGSETSISAVAGFPVSRGCLACGYVPTHMNEDWFFGFLKSRLDCSKTTLRLLALDGVSDTANLGSIIRTASALGVHAIVLSEDSCDAWYRRSIRVSMGHVFRIPIVRVANLERTISNLMSPPFHVTSYAAVAEKTANYLLNNVKPGMFC
jgi:SpoU rRNA Methylase family